ncbi:cell division protein FtsK [Actinobacillus seminis]|uniref:DNA translocase FtsK n=1 Tax=Actinobacillus seminis TaxID=722 RepID=A0A263HEI8_9PAST|nr:DNA translocase FtsK [Actinobacillus seminis]OZN25843.1 cell division protein FtsK [Actinobacillus seminis]SUU34643.1 cell division protein FtsK [Actinobacillus seminis]
MIKKISEHFTPKQYVIEFLLGLATLFGLYLIIAWISYNPFDSSWSVSSSQPVTLNKAGKLGAWVIDLFFALFGHVGNIIPFVLFIAPIYFIRTKRIDCLTWTRFSLRIFGFVLLLSGLTALSTLLLSNTPYYLSGGVLGGSLIAGFFSLLGKFGILLFAFILSVVGFIFCSGASLIRLLMRFYAWLTMKNEEPNAPQNRVAVEAPTEAEAIEEIIIQKAPTINVSENVTQGKLVDVRHLINIRGLTPPPTQTTGQGKIVSVATDVAQEAKANVFLEEMHVALPEVSIATEKSSADLGYSMDLATELLNVTISSKINSNQDERSPELLQSALDFSLKHDMVGQKSIALKHEKKHEKILDNEEAMPKVSLPADAQTAPKMTALIPAEDEAVDDPEEADLHNELARQFAAQEQQRLEALASRAKALNAEEALNVILAPTNVAHTLENASSMPYKSYSDTLIHPALQRKSMIIEKPTTPLPTLDLLEYRPAQAQQITREEIEQTSRRIEQQLRNFNVKATVKDVLIGPVVTRYELELQPGVKASKVSSIDTDLARALMFRSIRVAEVIPGKPYIGIETPNVNRQTVPLRDVLDSDEFRQSKSLLSMALGKDISGKPVVVDLAKMPHLLVAGSTGSGKSVGVNTMILSLLFRVKPEEVKFIMIDPKVVELSIYNGIPHLLTEVVTDMKKAANALRWCVDEMERRYQLLSALRVRNIEGFNDKIDEYNAMGMPIPNPVWRPGDTMDSLPPPLEKLSYIVVIVDEFADLMMVAGKQIEELIARLAQKARAIGIHLILATQRPSVDVITGLIKANIPSRIAFTVASKIDSRTILDQTGAEALLGRGDMLYSGQGSSDLIRVHGAFMSDDEVARVADDWRARGKPNYIENILTGSDDEEENTRSASDSDDLDDLFDEVMEFVIATGTTSVSSIQRKFKVGFNRAARIMDQMEEQGIVSPIQNGKREILARQSNY